MGVQDMWRGGAARAARMVSTSLGIVRVREERNETHLVSRSITIIRTTKSSNTQSIMFNRISILSDFMRSYDGSDFIKFTPALGDVWSET